MHELKHVSAFLIHSCSFFAPDRQIYFELRNAGYLDVMYACY